MSSLESAAGSDALTSSAIAIVATRCVAASSVPYRRDFVAETLGRCPACRTAAQQRVGVARNRRVPTVEGIRERGFPAERRERVLQRKVDDAVHAPAQHLRERQRGIRRIRRARQRIFGRGEPARLKLARRERHAFLRRQRRGREIEFDAIVIADRVGVALVPVAHRPHGRRRRHFHIVGVDERRHDGAGHAAHLRIEPVQIRSKMRRGPGLIVDVGALIVVERHRDHEIRVRHELRQRVMQPARRIIAMGRVAHPFGGRIVAVRVLQRRGGGIAPFEDVVQRHAVRGPAQEPRRIAAVTPLVANHRARPHDQVKVQFARQLQHAAQIAARVRMAVEVECPVRRFVPVPRHVEVERVGARDAHGEHRVAPAFGRNAFVEERAAEEEERLAVDEQLRRAVALHDARVRERRRFGAARYGRERQQQRGGDREGPGRPQTRADQKDRRARGQRRGAEGHRDQPRTPEEKQPRDERDDDRQRVERQTVRRRLGAQAQHHDGEVSADALHEHDPGRERVDHRIERKERGRQRQKPEREQRDVRKAFRRMQACERRQKIAVARGGVGHARGAEQTTVHRGEAGDEDRHRDDDGRRMSGGALHRLRGDEGRVRDVAERERGEDAEVQRDIGRAGDEDRDDDGARNRAHGRDDFVADLRHALVAGIVVERVNHRRAERNDVQTFQRKGRRQSALRPVASGWKNPHAAIVTSVSTAIALSASAVRAMCGIVR